MQCGLWLRTVVTHVRCGLAGKLLELSGFLSTCSIVGWSRTEAPSTGPHFHLKWRWSRSPWAFQPHSINDLNHTTMPENAYHINIHIHSPCAGHTTTSFVELFQHALFPPVFTQDQLLNTAGHRNGHEALACRQWNPYPCYCPSN